MKYTGCLVDIDPLKGVSNIPLVFVDGLTSLSNLMHNLLVFRVSSKNTSTFFYGCTAQPWSVDQSNLHSVSLTHQLGCVFTGTMREYFLIMIPLALWHIIDQQNQNGRDCW